jgi:hypothetical protein
MLQSLVQLSYSHNANYYTVDKVLNEPGNRDKIYSSTGKGKKVRGGGLRIFKTSVTVL